MSTTDEQFRNQFFANNKIDKYKYFNPHRLTQIHDDPGVKGIPFLFVTTPSLNFSSYNLSVDGFMSYVNSNEPHLLAMLTTALTGAQAGTSPFITLLSNKFHEFTTKDVQTVTKEVGETYYGYKQLLPNTQAASRSGDTVSIGFHDTKYMDVLKLHKIWVDYTEYITRGLMKPSDAAKANKVIDYTSSIYYFLLDMDGETIQYYSKYTGCYPTMVPYSEMSGKVGGNQDTIHYTVEYAYAYKEDMDPAILYDFNAISRNAGQVLSFGDPGTIMFNAKGANPAENDIYVDQDHNRYTRPIVGMSSTSKKFKLQFV